MKISDAKHIVYQQRKLEDSPSVFHEVLEKHFSVSKENQVNDSSDKSVKSKKELDDLAKEINKLSEDKNVYVSFSVDDKTGKNIIKFVNHANNEVVKQIPSEEMLQVVNQIDAFMKKNSKSFPPGFLISERT